MSCTYAIVCDFLEPSDLMLNDLARFDKGKAIHETFGGISAVLSNVSFTSSALCECPTDAGDIVKFVGVGDHKQGLRIP